ncbi:rhodanese-related sulfurtransferase [Lutibacter sp. Hel_I_33_5]|uniref:rhodanese-like domain-containing protein n=1 Tax=Lutibacter sp. Hel_I_33_5 TaxID=1566289 RepID=UPI0011AA10B8|nr:rhodanese-like domain-containing protein [Lutibacter sp. Hel_I_33_5]TVZ56833.1 rhodanese-related sulfurtransferase [Lutibacter sp. Hel_I_33_5]
MKKIVFLFVLISLNSFSQESLKDLLKKYNTESVPYISVDSLKKITKKPFDSTLADNNIILLDAREKKEYKVSHLKNALFVGYDKFNLKKTTKNLPNKNAKIVVYCSLGVRSEIVAEKLKKAGYTNVLNLYGGIFEWKNNGNTVFNSKEKSTEKVHTCTKEWSQWLVKGEKVYE